MELYLCSPPVCFHGVERGQFAFMWIFSVIESLGNENKWSGMLLRNYQTTTRVTTWVIVAKPHIDPLLFTPKVPTEQHMAQRAQVYIARYNPRSVTANCVAGVVRNTVAPVILSSRWRLPAQGSPTHSGPVPLDLRPGQPRFALLKTRIYRVAHKSLHVTGNLLIDLHWHAVRTFIDYPKCSKCLPSTPTRSLSLPAHFVL
jgi:hypothetical protein